MFHCLNTLNWDRHDSKEQILGNADTDSDTGSRKMWGYVEVGEEALVPSYWTEVAMNSDI